MSCGPRVLPGCGSTASRSSLDKPPKLSHRRKHKIEVVVDRAIVRRATRSRLADSIESALDLGKGVVHVARVGDEASEPSWPVDRYSQHRVCDRCGRSFDELEPHHFSFNSPLGWCPVCQGLGIQHGANPAVLVPDGRLSLRQGAVAVWPDFADDPLFARMIEAIGRGRGIRSGSPRSTTSTAVHAAIILHGAGETWYTVTPDSRLVGPGFRSSTRACSRRSRRPARVSFVYRFKLQGMVDDVPCAAAWGRGSGTTRRPLGSRVSRSTRSAAGRWGRRLAFFKDLNLDEDERHIAGDLVREVRDRLTFLVDVGLDYLSLARGTPTLSGGESQRIRLASQIGSGLTGVLYVLDEPTIGLHPRDNNRLLSALTHSARPRQHPGPGRARPRGHRGGRPPRRLRPRLGRRWRPDHRVGNTRPRSSHRTIRLTGPYLERQGRDPGADEPPAGRLGFRLPAIVVKGAAAQPQEHRRPVPAGRRHGRDGRLGLGQELLGGRHPVESGREGPAPRPTDPRRPRGDRGTGTDQ